MIDAWRRRAGSRNNRCAGDWQTIAEEPPELPGRPRHQYALACQVR